MVEIRHCDKCGSRLPVDLVPGTGATCPHCSHPVDEPDAVGGDAPARAPSRSSTVAVRPRAGTPSRRDPAAAASDRTTSSRATPPPAGSRSNTLVFAVSLGSGLLVALAAGLLLAGGNGKAPPAPIPPADAGSEGGAPATVVTDAAGEAVAEPAVSVVSDTPASDASGPATDEAPGPGVAKPVADADGADDDDFFAKLRADPEERRKKTQENRTGSQPSVAPRGARVALGDVTAKGGGGREGPQHAFDGDTKTKWYHGRAATTWVQCRLPEGARKAFGGYSITSANDRPQRDPMDWRVQGSDDGREWTTLDARTGEQFSKRRQTRSFRIKDPQAFRIYRLWIDKPLRAHDGIQLGEFQLTGETK